MTGLSHYQLHLLTAFFDSICDKHDLIVALEEKKRMARATKERAALADYVRNQLTILKQEGIPMEWMEAIVHQFFN